MVNPSSFDALVRHGLCSRNPSPIGHIRNSSGIHGGGEDRIENPNESSDGRRAASEETTGGHTTDDSSNSIQKTDIDPRSIKEMVPGDHVCALFNSTDFEAIIVPWIQHGLASHQRVVYLFTEESIDILKSALYLKGVDVDAAVESGQLIFECARTAYCPDGLWVEERVITFIRKETEKALEEGYLAARITADMTWTHNLLDDSALLHYESTVSCIFADLPLVGLCQYNRDFFSPKTLVKVLQAHHLTLVGTELYHNFYYTPADILLNKKYDLMLNRQLDNLRTKKDLEESNRCKTVALERKNKQLHFEIVKKERAEANLRQMHEEARKLARVKTDFLAQMSHEIRSPMNGVIGCADLLSEILELDPHNRSRTMVDQQREYVETIQSAGRYLMSIINNLLDHTKLEEQKLKLAEEPYKFSEILQTCINLNSPMKSRNVVLKQEISADVPCTLIGDSVRISQILNNLIGNAVKFTESGSIIISCTIIPLEGQTQEPTSTSQIQLLIAVEDTGHGIPENKHSSIFEPYEQADSTSKFKGWGLGLPICRQLINLMGGRIWVDPTKTRPGMGSLFKFCIGQKIHKQQDHPLPTDLFECVERSTRESSHSPLSLIPEAEKKQVSILIADDMKVNQLVIGRHLKSLGFPMLSFVDNGRQAVDAVKTSSFDIVFMDYHMPELNGMEAIYEIRAALQPSQLPFFVILSASNAIEEQAADKSVSWLVKPINRSKLVEALDLGLAKGGRGSFQSVLGKRANK